MSLAVLKMDTARSARDRFERMHHEIRSRICLLDYPPEMRLSEIALAAEFGVSRTPLRRVLVRLESEGLVRSVHGVGTIVTDVDIKELGQIYRLRMELAELTGKLDPVRLDPGVIAEFRRLAADTRQQLDAPELRAFAQLSMDFSLAAFRLTANEPLRAMCERLYFHTARIWLKSVFASTIDLRDEANVFHRETEDVLAALVVGDVEAAAHIQRAHISMSFNRMRKQ